MLVDFCCLKFSVFCFWFFLSNNNIGAKNVVPRTVHTIETKLEKITKVESGQKMSDVATRQYGFCLLYTSRCV